MDALFILLAISAVVSLVLGLNFSWKTILASWLVLAIVSAMVLQHQGFGFPAGIAIVTICLSLNQIANLVGMTLVHRDTIV